MKKHAIIPIFIPHEGCPNDCVFCNQKKITARTHAEEKVDIEETASRYLSTLNNPRPEIIEMAMYGGSFTGIPVEKQNEYLDIAKGYKDNGLIDKIHLSTRPDYISPEILENLKKHDVDIIELGVQSFDDEVLRLSERGHNSAAVYKSCELIKDYGFTLGIQLMVGLPGDTREKSVYSAYETVKIMPELARIYPTIVIEDTKLLDMYRSGQYTPLTLEEAVETSKQMYTILQDAGINIIRVGLKSSDIINEKGEIYGNTFHPAFRQLVESEIAKEKIRRELERLASDGSGEIILTSNEHSFSNMIGMKGSNKKYFSTVYPEYRFLYRKDNTLPDYKYKAELR
ncbi:MAG: radical SAM protein [Bacillota bacterium]|nr:radical SAM protein [Bacillota bacterium]